MAFEENVGINNLARVLSGRMADQARMPAAVDFGVIDEEYNLIMNRFPLKIPVKDYTVCRHLCERELLIDGSTDPEKGYASAEGGSHGGHQGGDGSHVHSVEVMYKTRYLKPGDRVLVVRIGNTASTEAEFCVIDLIVPAADIRKEGVQL